MFIDIHGFPFNNHAEGASKAMAKQLKTFPTSQESAWSSFAKTTLGEVGKTWRVFSSKIGDTS